MGSVACTRFACEYVCCLIAPAGCGACLSVCAGESISEEEMREMIEEADRDHDGYVTFEDFFRIMKKKSSNPLDDLDDDEDF